MGGFRSDTALSFIVTLIKNAVNRMTDATSYMQGRKL